MLCQHITSLMLALKQSLHAVEHHNMLLNSALPYAFRMAPATQEFRLPVDSHLRS